MDTKLCARCRQEFPATVEHFRLTSRGYLDSWCRPCRREYQRHYLGKRDPEYQKRYREKNRERVRAYERKSYLKHREKVIRKTTEWKKRNPELFRLYMLRHGLARRERRHNNGGTLLLADIRRQRERQNGICYWCREKINGKGEVDHVIPLSKGGANDPSNIVIACRHCNRTKAARMPADFIGKLL